MMFAMRLELARAWAREGFKEEGDTEGPDKDLVFTIYCHHHSPDILSFTQRVNVASKLIRWG
jgi:hypothetical protein